MKIFGIIVLIAMILLILCQLEIIDINNQVRMLLTIVSSVGSFIYGIFYKKNNF